MDGELSQRTLSLAKSLAGSSELGILTEDRETLSYLIKGAKEEGDFFYLRVSDNEGNTLAEGRAAGTPEDFPSDEHLARVAQVDKPFAEKLPLAGHIIHSVAVPAVTYGAEEIPEEMLFGGMVEASADSEKSRKIGSVVLHLSSKRTDKLLEQSRRAIFLLGLIVVAIAIITIYFLSRPIIRPITELARAATRVGKGDLEVHVPVRSRDEVGHLAHSFNMMGKGLKEKEKLKETFGRYVSPQVAHKILKEMDSIKLGGESVEVTVLFADVRKFTAFAEEQSPEDVVSTLNDYFS